MAATLFGLAPLSSLLSENSWFYRVTIFARPRA